MNLFAKIYYQLTKLLSPPHCYFCKAFMNDYVVLCKTCTQLIKPVVSVRVLVTQKYMMTVHAVSDYEEPLRSLILAKSRSDYTASKLLAQLIWQHSALKNINFDYLVPIPLHWTRYAYRGYNQSQVLAQELSNLTKKPIAACVKRFKRTVFQSALKGSERKDNVSQAFQLATSNCDYEGKTFLLVDDLMTTGSTLQAVAKVLTALKPQAIHAIVACRVSK